MRYMQDGQLRLTEHRLGGFFAYDEISWVKTRQIHSKRAKIIMPGIFTAFDRWVVHRALRDYPIYAPPFPGKKAKLTHKQVEANFEYFTQQKEKRLQYLSKFLAKYSVSTGFEIDDLDTVGAWLYRYGGHLIRGKNIIYALEIYDPAWSGTHAGLNIINDISIYAGEFIIHHNPYVYWTLFYDSGEVDVDADMGYCHPCLGGLHSEFFKDPFYICDTVFCCCDVQSSRLRGKCHGGEPWMRKSEFAEFIRYLADPNHKPLSK